MTESDDQRPSDAPDPAATSGQPKPKAARWNGLARWKVPAVATIAGLLVGGGIGAASTVAATDPTRSTEYQALQEELGDAKKRAETLSVTARAAQESATEARNDVAAQAGELAARERKVAAREQAVAVVEQRVAATSIGQGTWTVGRDVEPGTYRAAQAVTRQCYWGIYVSGTNGDDIVENDVVDGGFPTVTLREGQDFKNNGCGTFVKQ